MPPFAGLTDEDLDALRHYIRAVAHRDAGADEADTLVIQLLGSF